MIRRKHRSREQIARIQSGRDAAFAFFLGAAAFVGLVLLVFGLTR